MILVSASSVKCSLFDGHSKVFNFSSLFEKCLLNVLAISSLFTNKVSFSTISFVFVVISSFSSRIILESAFTCLLEFFDVYKLLKYWSFVSLLSLATKFRCFLHFLISSCFFVLLALRSSAERFIMTLRRFLSTWGLWLPRKTLLFLGAWASKTLTKVSSKFK